MTSPDRESLHRQHGGHWEIPILAGIALLCLIPGTMVGVLRFESLFGDNEMSVLKGILAFVRSGDVLLALLLFSFSVLFPAGKLVALLWTWFVPLTAGRRDRVIGWLEVLGKWSMLDAFVSALLVGAVQLGILGEMVLLPGIYLYLGAILLSLVATFWLAKVAGTAHRLRTGRPARWPIPFTVLALCGHGVGLFLPMLSVSGGWFWDHDYSFASGVGALLTSDNFLLGLVLALFVGVLPIVRFVLVLLWRAGSGQKHTLLRLLLFLDRWSMGDVFLLALLVVLSKLGKLAEGEPRPGLWLLGAANLLGVLESIKLQQRVELEAEG